MSISFIGAGAIVSPTNNAASFSIPAPAGVTQGDLLIAMVSLRYSVNVPSGWTKVEEDGSQTAQPFKVVSLLARTAGPSEPASYTFTTTAGIFDAADAGVIVAYRGALVDAHAGTTGYGTTQPAPAVSASGQGWGLRFWMSTKYALTLPNGIVQRYSGGVADVNVIYLGDSVSSGDVGTVSATSAFSTNYTAQTVALISSNAAPNAPIPTSPIGGATVDRSSPVVLRATFSDPDPGDSPSASQWRYRVTGTSTWTTATQNNPLQTYTIAAGIAAGDYEWQAAYADAQGVWSPFSASEFFTAATPPDGPTVLEPADGATIPTQSFLFRWSYPAYDSYQAQLLDGTGAIITDFGETPGMNTVGVSFGGIPNNVTRTAQVRVKTNGLWSAWAAVTVTISYAPPPAPVVTLMGDQAHGCLVVGISNPAAGVGQPDAAYNDVLVDDADGRGEERKGAMLVPNQPWTYWTPRSGVDYGPLVRIRVVATNGTTAYSEPAAPAPVFEDIDGGTPTQAGTEYLDAGGI